MLVNQKHLLVVEDDAVLGGLLRRILAAAGYDVLLVFTGEQGLEALEQRWFDLVITDIDLPGCDGFAVLRAAQALAVPVQVLLMTGGGAVVDVQLALQAGAADCLFKPFAIQKFLDCIAVCCLASRRPAEA